MCIYNVALLSNRSLSTKCKVAFNKLSNATSPTRKETHQDADSTNDFPSAPGTQHNRYHFFLRR
jgi:hypothetical protein